MNLLFSNGFSWAIIVFAQWMWTLNDDKGLIAIYNVALTLNLLSLMAISISSKKSKVAEIMCILSILITLLMFMSGLTIVMTHLTYSYHFIATSTMSLLMVFSILGLSQ